MKTSNISNKHCRYQFIYRVKVWSELSVQRLLCDHDCARGQPNATTSPYPDIISSPSCKFYVLVASPDEDWVLDPSVVHELDDLVQEDPGRGDPHPVGDGEDGADLVHGVPEIIQCRYL